MRALVLALCLALCCGCAALASTLPLVAKIAHGSQWIGSLIDVASGGAAAYYARHPKREAEAEVAAAIARARAALAALDAAIASAKAADDGELVRARAEALRAYSKLRELLSSSGVLTATPPPGGAETSAPLPEPLAMPTIMDVEASM